LQGEEGSMTAEPGAGARRGAEVVELRWPDDAARRAGLAATRAPRLWHVPAAVDPPIVVDELEDWIRAPADPVEVAARLVALRSRAGAEPQGAHVDDDGVFRLAGRRAALSPTEAALARVLLAQSGLPIDADGVRAHPAGGGRLASANVPVTVTRLRQRLADLGVTIVHVRGTGFVCHVAGTAPDGGRAGTPPTG
jgi:hypothetical protein